MSFLSDLMRFESSGQNVTNKRQSTSSGRARGFFQITDGTWKDFSRRAGVDLARYPTALSAPYAVQFQVASTIPLKRWDPITLRRLSAAGHRFDVSKTLGENLAAKGEKATDAPVVSPQTANLGPLPEGYQYDTPPNVGQTTENPPAEDQPEGLASAFADALGGSEGSAGGEASGGYGSGFQSDSPGPLSLPYETVSPSVEELASPWETSEQARTPGQLADLFTLPTIGEPASKKKALLEAQASGLI
jgi:hypothetical protein